MLVNGASGGVGSFAVKGMAEAGQIAPLMDDVYPLDRGAEAILHLVDGHARGTVVIDMTAEKPA